MLDKILESLDPQLFTDDMKAGMKSVFEQKVNEQVEALSEGYDKKLNEASEQFDKKIETISEKYENQINEYSEQFEEEQKKEMENFKKDLIENLNNYLERIVGDIISENKKENIEKAIVEEAVEIHKMFDGLMETYNFNFKNLGQKAEDSSKISELSNELNKAIEENTKLKESLRVEKNEKDNLVKSEITDSVANKFESDVQKYNFIKIAEGFTFESEDKESFTEKLNSLYESMNKEDFQKGRKIITDAEPKAINEDVEPEEQPKSDFMKEVLKRL